MDMNTPLVDTDGFPNALIDVITVRKIRNSIICLFILYIYVIKKFLGLGNDRKKLLSEMSEALLELHQSTSVHTTASLDNNNVTKSVHRTSNNPFAKIDYVESNSPADKAVTYLNILSNIFIKFFTNLGMIMNFSNLV